jgi:hypothetical protein
MLPKDWKIEFENDNSVWQGGQLHLEPEQEKGYLSGDELFNCLKDKAYNAKVLDYLLKHKKEIPKNWKDREVYFWGTTYRNSDRELYVRCLVWDGGRWSWRCRWLGNGFSGYGPAAVPVSKTYELAFEPSLIELSYNGKKYKLVEIK